MRRNRLLCAHNLLGLDIFPGPWIEMSGPVEPRGHMSGYEPTYETVGEAAEKYAVCRFHRLIRASLIIY